MDEITAYVKERGDRIYLQSPVQVYEPDAAEIETFAFKGAVEPGVTAAPDLKQTAPNPHILWAQGRYVEAERANLNADYWRADDLIVKAFTPTLMPITVMHDLRSAVGVIAHTALKLPAEDPIVPRPRLENILAIWAHRFPEVAEETRVNAKQGTLMQSMECISPHYDCSVCGAMLVRTADWQAEWRAHVGTHPVEAGGELRAPARILRGVVFTGTGLIFGTRGARGAYSEANVEVEALAELHAKSHDKAHRPQRRRNRMELDDAKYQDLVARSAAAAAAEAKVTELTASVAAKDTTIETLEAAKVKAEGERDAEKSAREAAETKANIAAMREDRLGKFGTAFAAALDKRANTKAKVHEQAGTLADADWLARVTELEELLDVKADAVADPAGGAGDKAENGGSGAPEGTAGLLFDREVVANAGIAPPAGAAGSSAPSPAARQSVIGGLVRRTTRPPAPAAK